MDISRTLPATALAVAAGTLAVPVAARAATLPVGTHAGVSIKSTPKATTVSFGAPAAKAFREIAGRKVTVTCERLTSTPYGLTSDKSSESNVRAPKRRRAFRAGNTDRRADVCSVTRPEVVTKRGGKTTIDAESVVARVPLTQTGATYVAELETSEPLTAINGVAVAYALRHGNRFPSLAVVQATFAKAKLPVSLVALANPAASPPAGKVGYFTDGTTATAVATAPTGRRLYVESAPDNRLSTNVPIYLFGGED